VGIALINTFGNIAGFAAGYVTGWLKDASGSYNLPMFVVGGLMLMSAVLMILLARRGRNDIVDPDRVESAPQLH
jgi:nitrate/nitrite transporter NarK